MVTLADVVRGLEREIDDAERAMRFERRNPEADGLVPEYAAGDALSEVMGMSRSLYQDCSQALETVDTLAAITEPRHRVTERSDRQGDAGNDDDIWMYE